MINTISVTNIARPTSVGEYPWTQERYLETFIETVRERPFVSIGVAAGVGYVVAGGVPTWFTLRLIRNGMRVAVVTNMYSRLTAFKAAADTVLDRK